MFLASVTFSAWEGCCFEMEIEIVVTSEAVEMKLLEYVYPVAYFIVGSLNTHRNSTVFHKFMRMEDCSGISVLSTT